MGQIKHNMGKVGGGVDISHKSKMSNAAKNQMSYPGGMPGPGNYGSTNNVVGKGMTKYLAGESVGMRKYGKHMGPEKALVGNQENLPEGLKAKIEAAPEGPAKRKMTAAQKKLMEEPPMSGGPSKYGKHKGPKQEGDLKAIQSPRQKRLAKEKKDEKQKNSDLVNKPLKLDKFVPKKKKSKSDMEKIQESKKNKIKAGKEKKAEGQSDLKKARETKFVSRGSGEDSGVSTREERRTAIRAARQKKREGRRAERKARKGTVIKQKSVRIKKSDD